MNYSLVAADRATHVKIVLVALAASIAVNLAAIYARPIAAKTQVSRVEVEVPLANARQSQAVIDVHQDWRSI